MTNNNQKIQDLQALDLSRAVVSLWLVHRQLRNKQASYKVLKVEVETALAKKLKQKMLSAIDGVAQLQPYQFITTDLGRDGLLLAADDTDFATIKSAIDHHDGDAVLSSMSQLEKSWGYVTCLRIDDQLVYGYRKTGSSFKTKNVGGYFSFHNNVLIDLDHDKIFTLDLAVDFFCDGNDLIILNKNNFESAMNFRQGMEAHRDETLQDFEQLGLFADVGPLREAIGGNINMLRKVAAVHHNGYYKNPNYMRRLAELNQQRGWGLDIEDGKIAVNAENATLILTLLNNDRLMSELTDETFDVNQKSIVESVLA